MQMRIFIESNHDLEMLRMGPYALAENNGF